MKAAQSRQWRLMTRIKHHWIDSNTGVDLPPHELQWRKKEGSRCCKFADMNLCLFILLKMFGLTYLSVRTLWASMSSYQFYPQHRPSALCFTPLLVSLCQLSQGGGALFFKQVRSPGVMQLIFQQSSESANPEQSSQQTLSLSLYHDLVHFVNKDSQITSERREWEWLVLYCIHKEPKRKVWVSHSLNIALYHWC